MSLINAIKLWNLWPPFLGAGIKIKKVTKNFRHIKVEMNMYPWNKNLVGTHFGGSLYAMTDPFFMTILMKNLGNGYIVWDKAASIDFKRPGKGKVFADFEISQEEIQNIKDELKNKKKIYPVFKVQIKDKNNNVIAEVNKTLYITKKKTS